MKTYPIMLKLTGRRVVVVGGGAVGTRRAIRLAQAGAEATLVAEQISGDADLAALTVLRQPYRQELLAGAFLVLACTDDRAVNSRIAADARAAGALVNVADQPEDCDFFLPATLTDGDVVVAVGTGGLAPGLAVEIKDRLAAALPQRLGEFAQAIDRLRRNLRAGDKDPAARMWIIRKLCERAGYEAFLAGGAEALETMARGLLERP
jgi:precorrin-2 dehydrogenase/sirohydrochlorin ferrochelatase